MISEAKKRRLFRDLDKRDPRFIEKIEPFVKGLYDHYFRVEIEGFENVPETKTLFVGNHNGMITFEVLMLFYAWYKEFGLTRRALGLAHKVALDNILFSWLCPKIGAIPADPDVADEAISRGFSLLVYPGGEKEAFRPFVERKKIDFFNRTGFIRLALRNKISITPIVSVGAHETYLTIHRGEEIAKKLGLYDKYRLHGVPITAQSLFFMWCMATGIFTFFPLLLAPAAFASIFVPLPAKMQFQILPPIDICSMVQDGLSEKENHQRIYDHIQTTMQSVMNKKYSERRFPIIG